MNGKDVAENRLKEEWDEEYLLYLLAIRLFKKKDYVSSGSLQKDLQIPYLLARSIFDRMIKEEFCEAQVGAKPCRIFKYKN